MSTSTFSKEGEQIMKFVFEENNKTAPNIKACLTCVKPREVGVTNVLPGLCHKTQANILRLVGHQRVFIS